MDDIAPPLSVCHVENLVHFVDVEQLQIQQYQYIDPLRKKNNLIRL